MLVLGIESSCDETAAAIIKDGRSILSNIVASQVEIHNRYGGVVPEVASRQQLSAILPVIETALDLAHCSPAEVDAIRYAWKTLPCAYKACAIYRCCLLLLFIHCCAVLSKICRRLHITLSFRD